MQLEKTFMKKCKTSLTPGKEEASQSYTGGGLVVPKKSYWYIIIDFKDAA
jgi:hypothetical protein